MRNPFEEAMQVASKSLELIRSSLPLSGLTYGEQQVHYMEFDENHQPTIKTCTRHELYNKEINQKWLNFDEFVEKNKSLNDL